MLSFVNEIGKFIQIIFYIKIFSSSTTLKVWTNRKIIILPCIIFFSFVLINIGTIYFLYRSIFFDEIDMTTKFYSHRDVSRYTDLICISFFMLNQIIILYQSFENRQKHVNFLKKLHTVEIKYTSLYRNSNECQNLNYFIFVVYFYFLFCCICLKHSISIVDWNSASVYLVMIGYNLQYQITLSIGIYIRFILLIIRKRIRNICGILKTILLNNGNINNLKPNYYLLCDYFNIKYEFGKIFGKQLKIMFLCCFVIVITLLFSVKTQYTSDTRVYYAFYDISANIIPSIMLVIGLVTVIHGLGNEVIFIYCCFCF